MLLTAAGSAYYHLEPDNETLFWDRLPMTIAFMALVASQVVDRIDVRAGLALLAPMLVLGVASVIYWRITERAGAGNVVPYGVLQAYSVVMLLLMAALTPSRYTRGGDLYWVFGWYVLSKVLEALDTQVLELGHCRERTHVEASRRGDGRRRRVLDADATRAPPAGTGGGLGAGGSATILGCPDCAEGRHRPVTARSDSTHATVDRISMLMRPKFLLALATASCVPPAAAQTAIITNAVNVRAAPDRVFPTVTWLLGGTSVDRRRVHRQLALVRRRRRPRPRLGVYALPFLSVQGNCSHDRQWRPEPRPAANRIFTRSLLGHALSGAALVRAEGRLAAALGPTTTAAGVA